MAALMEQRAGNTQTARLLWTTIYESSDDENIRKNALTRLVALKVDENVWQLEAMTKAYFERTGKYPASWQDLIAMKWLRGVPTDPSGTAYVLTPDGHVVVQDPQKFPFIQRGIPAGMSAVDNITPESQKVVEGARVAPTTTR
jgi:hypothetical protein